MTIAAALTAVALLSPPAPARADDARTAYSVAVTGVISSRTDFALRRSIAQARDAGAALLILRIDTPGGSLEATRRMIQKMLDAPMPIVAYVSPSGAGADSAGMMLTLAADVAAMAPATNIGSATPVRPGVIARNADEERTLRELDRKATNSLVAFARSLAEERGRNADAAERMIRKADNASARQALRVRVVDVLAPTETQLLERIDGFAVKGRKAQTLRTAGLEITRAELFDVAPAPPDADADDTSLTRSIVLIVGTALTLLLVAVGTRRGRRSYRRWQRRRRVEARRRARGD